MADVSVGSIGGTLELTDTTFSRTLGDADDALKKADKSAGLLNKTLTGFSNWIQREGKGAQEILNGISNKILHVAEDSEHAAFSTDKMKLALASVATSAITAGITAVVAVVAAIGAAAVATVISVAAMTVKAANLGDELLTMSKQTQVSVEALSAYKFIAEQTGVSLTTISTGVSKFTADLGKGSKAFNGAIGALGLSITQLRNSKPEDAFAQVIDALGKVPNAADRAAVGTRLFGTNFRKISGLIGEDITGMKKDFDSFGGKVTTEMAVAGDAFNDAKSRLGAMMDAVEVQIGSTFVPVVAAAFTAIGDAWVTARSRIQIDGAKMSDAVDKVGAIIIKFVATNIRAIAELTQVFADFFAARWVGTLKVLEYLAKVGEALASIQALQSSFTSKSDSDFAMRLANNFKSLGEFATGAQGAIVNVRDGIIKTAEVVDAFGEALNKDATKSIADMHKAIADAAAEARKAGGDFKGLGTAADQSANRAAMAWNKYVQGIAANFHKQWLVIVKEAQTRANAVGETFLLTAHDQEEAGRLMARASMDETRFELSEIARRTAARVKELEVLKSTGVNIASALQAVAAKADAEMFDLIAKTERYREVLTTTNLSSMFDALPNKVRDLSGIVDDDTQRVRDARQAWVDFATDITQAIGAAIKSGQGVLGIAENVSNVLSQKLVSSASSYIQKSIQSGAMGAGAGIGAAVATYGLSLAVDYAIKFWQDQKNLQAAHEAGAAAASSFAAGFGGMLGARRFAHVAGIDSIDLGHVLNPSTVENFQQALAKIQPQIDAFNNKIKGLGVAAEGANTLVAGFVLNYSKSIKTQFDVLDAAQKAHIEAMKAGGATAEQIDADTAAFTESMKTHVYESTEAQIAAFNRAGTIIGGIIANTVNTTGDLVGAIMSVGDALQGLEDFKDKFGLGGDQISAATTQVLALYDTVKNNEDVFTSISGIGQVMNGLGDALVRNSTLANAFGGELAADFQTLVDRGVDVNTIWASMAPQLQQLWEAQKDGRITVDATTKALLDQAEAAGVVGDTQRDVNEQILMVLTDIRDLIGYVGDVALPRMGTAAANAGSAVQRSLAKVGGAARDAAREVDAGLNGIKEPNPITVKVHFDVDDLPDWTHGETWSPDPTNPHPSGPPRPEGFASGSDGFRNFGGGTSAVLHGLERVQTYAQYQNERAGGGGDSAPGVIIQVDGETIVAVNARNKTRWEQIRTGTSPRTVR